MFELCVSVYQSTLKLYMSLCIQKEISFSKTIYLKNGLNIATTCTTTNAIMILLCHADMRERLGGQLVYLAVKR